MEVIRSGAGVTVKFTDETLLGFVKTCGEVLGLSEAELDCVRVEVLSAPVGERDDPYFRFDVTLSTAASSYAPNTQHLDRGPYRFDPVEGRGLVREPTRYGVFEQDGVAMFRCPPVERGQHIFEGTNMSQRGTDPRVGARLAACRQATQSVSMATSGAWRLYDSRADVVVPLQWCGRTTFEVVDYHTAVAWVRDGRRPAGW